MSSCFPWNYFWIWISCSIFHFLRYFYLYKKAHNHTDSIISVVTFHPDRALPAAIQSMEVKFILNMKTQTNATSLSLEINATLPTEVCSSLSQHLSQTVVSTQFQFTWMMIWCTALHKYILACCPLLYCQTKYWNYVNCNCVSVSSVIIKHGLCVALTNHGVCAELITSS